MSNMGQGWYVPTTEEVCDGFRGDHRKFEQAGESMDATGSNYGPKCYAAFHRWLKEHDERIRREALTLTDEEAGLVAKKMDSLNLPEETEQYGEFQPVDARTLFDYLSKIRERES